MSKRVDDLKARVCDARVKLTEAENRLLAAQIEEAPFQVGDEAMAGRKRVIVRSIAPYSSGDYWYTVSRKNLDGAWSQVAFGEYKLTRPTPNDEEKL